MLLVGTPLGVSRALQRLGRSGHRIDGVANGALVPLSLPDVVRGIALRRTPPPTAVSTRCASRARRSTCWRRRCSA